MDYSKVIIAGEDPGEIAEEYMDYPLILIYPRDKNPKSRFLVDKNITILHSEYHMYPSIESLNVVRDLVLYMLNSGIIRGDDRVLLIFSKKGENYRIEMDMSQLQYPTIVSLIGERLGGEVVEKILRLAMSILVKGREGFPAGALLVVGDVENVKKYLIQKIANPIKAMSMRERSILYEENFDTLREFATMDGATIIDSRGYVVTCGAYIKSLFVEDWDSHGLGGRHLAGKSITRLTRAVSFVVSSEGTIRIYLDGKQVYEVEGF